MNGTWCARHRRPFGGGENVLKGKRRLRVKAVGSGRADIAAACALPPRRYASITGSRPTRSRAATAVPRQLRAPRSHAHSPGSRRVHLLPDRSSCIVKLSRGSRVPSVESAICRPKRNVLGVFWRLAWGETTGRRPWGQRKNRMELSVVIPVKNEAGNIAPLVAEIAAALDGRIDYEIVYVDDGSSDATAAEIRDLQHGMTRLRLIGRAVFLDLPFFGHMHRFLPALVLREGGIVRSMPVNHRPRQRGTSNYGVFDRLGVGIVDLLGVLWLGRRAARPRLIEQAAPAEEDALPATPAAAPHPAEPGSGWGSGTMPAGRFC